MKNKGLRIIIVLAVMAAILYYLKNGSRPDRQDFHIENTDDIVAISIADKQPSSILVERGEDGDWIVDKSYKARKGAIDILLETLRRMRVKEPVAKSKEVTIFKRLASFGKKVTVTMRNGDSKTIYVGTETPNHMGTYMMIAGASKPYVVHIPGFNGYLDGRFFTHKYEWKSREIVAWDNLDIQTISIDYPNSPENSFTLEISPEGDISLLDQLDNPISSLDTVQAQLYLANYRNVHFEGLVTDGDRVDKEAILDQTPVFVMNLLNFEGDNVHLVGYLRPNYKEMQDENGQLYPYDPERMYAVLNEDDFVLIQYYTFDKLLVQKSHFIVNN